MTHRVRVKHIKDGLREQYRQQIMDTSHNDEMNAVAFVMIDALLEMMTEMLEEYDNLMTVCEACHNILHPERLWTPEASKRRQITPERW
mgnify:CR=1 FL=1